MIGRDELEKIFLEMCKYDTTNPPGNEEPLALYIKETLESYGIDCTIQRVGTGRVNLLAKIDRNDGLPHLLFAGHMDVVPAASGWTSEPFKPVVENGRVYARGSADMKAGLASMLAAYIDLSGDERFGGNLAFLATCDEEVGCSGVKRFLEENTLEIAGALIGEPTSMRLAGGEKGAVWSELNFKGKSAHGSQPHEGINAVLLLIDAYRRIAYELGGVEDLTVSLNRISGGSKENTVPDSASCVLDIRFMSNISPSEVTGIIDKVLLQFEGAGQKVLLTRNPFSSSGRLSGCACSTLEGMGRKPEPLTMTYFTDGAFIAPAGIETVILGPGAASMAHKANEYVELEEIHIAREVYGKIARNFFQGCV
jgi:succinyl-diaminopimelate desuccinylase